MAEPTLDDANRNKPTIPCPMLHDCDEVYNEYTGDMEFEQSDCENQYKPGDLTWSEWYSEYKSVLPEVEVWEWHKWCWENQTEYEDARTFVKKFGKPVDRTTTRIKQRSKMEIAWERKQQEKATNAPSKKAEAKK